MSCRRQGQSDGGSSGGDLSGRASASASERFSSGCPGGCAGLAPDRPFVLCDVFLEQSVEHSISRGEAWVVTSSRGWVRKSAGMNSCDKRMISPLTMRIASLLRDSMHKQQSSEAQS